MSGSDHLKRNKLKLLKHQFYTRRLAILHDSIEYLTLIENKLPMLDEYRKDNTKIIRKLVD